MRHPAILLLTLATGLVAGPAADLRVLRSLPAGDATPMAPVLVTFDRPIAASLEGVGVDPVRIFRILPAVEGRVEWRDPVTLRFTPAVPYTAGVTYRVTIDTGFAAMDGTRLPAPHRFEFRVRGPKLLLGLPVGPTNWRTTNTSDLITPRDTFVLAVSRPVTPAQVARSVWVETERSCSVGRRVIRLTMIAQDPIDTRGRWELRESGGYDRDRRADSLRRVVALVPQSPLPLNCEAALVVPPWFDAEGEELPGRFSFRTYPPFSLLQGSCTGTCTAPPTGPLSVSFSTPVRGRDLLRHLKILPQVPVAISDTDGVASNWNITEAALTPRTPYAVVVDTGLRDIFGQRLIGNPVVTRVTTPHEPSVQYTTGRMLVERNGWRTLAVRHVNHDTLFVAIRPLTDSLYAEYLRRGPWQGGQLWRSLDSTAEVRVVRVRGDRDRAFITGVALPHPDASRARPPAAYAVKVRGNVRADRVRGAWDDAGMAVVLVTDLAIVSRASEREASIWVTSATDGRPRRGARVELFRGNGTRIAQGTTDSAGLVKLTGYSLGGTPAEDEEECYDECGGGSAGGAFVAVQLGADRTVLGVNESAYDLAPWQFNAYPAWGIAKREIAATVFTERDIYRPGEPVYAKVIVRSGPLGALRSTPGDSVRLVFSDRDDGELRASVLRLSEFGTASDSIRLPADAKLGDYRVAVMVYRDGSWQHAASDGYRVAEYRAPEFVVRVTGDSSARFPGDSVRVGVEARYLFGAPMGRAAVRWTARLASSWISSSAIPGLGDGWYLGASGFWWEEGQGGGTSVAAEGVDTLDAAGLVELRVSVGRTPRGHPGRLTVEATVTDVNRRSVAGSAGATVHPASFYIAAKPTGEYFWKGGEPQRIDLLAVRPDGRKVAGAEIRGTFIRREWHQVTRSRRGYSELVGEWVEDTVGRCTVRSAEMAVGCRLTPEKGGSYIVRFDATDEQGREVQTSFYRWATGAGWVPWNDDSRFKLDVIADKSVYAPGDTATLVIASPFTDAEAWFTVEREGIIEQRRLRITDGSTRIRLPITEAHTPNIFASIVVVRGRSGAPGSLDDPGRPALRVGYTQLQVRHEVKRLQVAVTTAREEYRPGDSADVRVAVRANTGGVRSEVTLWAVDEGVLSLTGFRTPDPLERLYTQRGLGLTLSSNLIRVAPQVLRDESRELKGLLNAGHGGGGDGADVLRSRFQTTAFFLGSVVTGNDGRGSAKVKLPDNVTTFRVMAVAVTATDRFGSGEAKLLVTRPLLARPSLPRFFRPGDEFLAGVVVNQRAGGTPTVVVDVTAQGVTLGGPARQSVALEAGRGREVRFPFTGRAGDSASFRFDVSGAGDRDAVRTGLPIRPDFHPRATTIAGLLTDTATVTFTLAAGLDPARTRVELSTGASPFAVLRGLDRELRLYDWLCTEQVVSVATPLLELWKAQQISGDSITRRDARERLDRAIAMVVRRQRPDGSFNLWDHSSTWTTPWLTAYAGAFLVEARQAGLGVEKPVLDRAAAWLAQQARNPVTINSPAAHWQEALQARLRERLAAADFVSRMGEPDLAAENDLVRSAPQMWLEDRVRLASVLARRGATRNARMLLEPIWRNVRVEGNRAVYTDSIERPGYFYFHSTMRPTARLLQATMAVDSNHALVGPLVQTLVQRGRSERARGYWWWNTQDAAFTATALAEFGRRQVAARGRGVTVTAGGRTFATLTPGDTVVSRAANAQGVITPHGRDSVRLTFRLNSPGTGAALFYALSVYDVPLAQPVTPDDRGIRVERWYETMTERRPIGTITEGELVRVRLRITVGAERQFVVVDDPLPAGLEGVDLSLATETQQGAAADCSTDYREEGSGWGWWYGSWDGCSWSPFDHKELRDDRVVWVASVLWPGTYNLSYVARATTPGTYKRPTAWAEEMYNPGVNGRTEGGTFRVRPR
jgi:uncharacterized protein YfaS (alpha-2-macroglobulin family)